MQERFLGRMVKGMEIRDRDGDKLGTIQHVYRHDPSVIGLAGGSSRLAEQELMEVKTGFLGLGRRLYIPNAFIQDVTQNCVILSKTADEILRNEDLHYRPSYLDDLY